jgi:SAM-dependent methyltransferase
MTDNGIFIELNDRAKQILPETASEYDRIMKKCCLSICIDICRQLGIFRNKNEFETIESIKLKYGIPVDREYILKNILLILTEDNVIEKNGQRYMLKDLPDMETPSEMLVTMTKSFPSESDTFQWLARCYGNMIDILKGSVHAEDILFPRGDLELVEVFYSTSSIYNYYSMLGAIVIKTIVESNAGNKYDILEIGAGTGNGTDHVLEKTGNVFSKYVFSDISRTLLKRAKNKFRDKDFMEFKLLDIMNDPAVEESGKYEIIYAVNVLHSVKEVMTALKNIFSMLKLNGHIVLAEISPPENSIYRFMELTFGLLPSFYGHTDRELRPGTPLLRIEQWVELLNKAGFNGIHTVPPVGDMMQNIVPGGVITGMKTA